jgi:putative flippase GtrA
LRPYPSAMKRFARWLNGPKSWLVKSLASSAVGSALDYLLLFIAAKGMGLPTPLAAAIGLSAGATFNFFGNRHFVFRAASGDLVSQALRYALMVAGLMAVHACAMWLLRDELGVPLFIAKVAADLGVLAGTQPFLLRYFVFAAPRRAPALELSRRAGAAHGS